jgi:hypothetical protein
MNKTTERLHLSIYEEINSLLNARGTVTYLLISILDADDCISFRYLWDEIESKLHQTRADFHTLP